MSIGEKIARTRRSSQLNEEETPAGLNKMFRPQRAGEMIILNTDSTKKDTMIFAAFLRFF